MLLQLQPRCPLEKQHYCEPANYTRRDSLPEIPSLHVRLRSRTIIGLEKMLLICSTLLGVLYQADCLDLLRAIPEASVHTVFADPPFNLGKNYGRNGSDRRPDGEYLSWCRKWLDAACRTLVPGGALFVYNLPKWLIPIGAYLNTLEMSFKHWVAIHKPTSLPIPNRLCPSHYGLLYYIKGDRPRVFDRDAVRVPIRSCRHCGGDVKDYGGHRKFINPKGLNLGDVWDDVSPVRHRKYKNHETNELAPIVLERVIRLTTRKGDVIVDPFAGSGTTAHMAESLGRRWICGDLNDCAVARDRLTKQAQTGSILDTQRKQRVPRAFSILRNASETMMEPQATRMQACISAGANHKAEKRGTTLKASRPKSGSFISAVTRFAKSGSSTAAGAA